MLAQLNSPLASNQRMEFAHHNRKPHGERHYNDSVSWGSRPAGDDVGADLRKAALANVPKDEAPYQKNGEMFRNFPGREGYAPDFLGVALPLPQLDDSIKNQAAPLLDDPTKNELKYTHFSVIQNKERCTPMLTAVNIDGAQYEEHERDGKWVFDGRIAREHQMGNEAYSNNAIDKGHMVRRRDPMWGPVADKGQDDTFVYTNAALQHADLNQKNWLDLENHVLESATAGHKKVTVFTGPVLKEDDPSFNNHGKMELPTKMPREFFKVVVWNEPGQGLKSESYVMSQADFMNKEQSHEPHIKLTEFETFRIPTTQLEAITHIDFGDLKDDCTRAQRVD